MWILLTIITHYFINTSFYALKKNLNQLDPAPSTRSYFPGTESPGGRLLKKLATRPRPGRELMPREY